MKRLLSLALLCLLPALAQGHGWVSYPKARQAICHDDGGYWSPPDGSAIPNAACRAAFVQSGAYPFTQLNELSANVAQYWDLAAVQAVVKDGSLCSAGDSAKAGLDLPSGHWQKTSLAAGQAFDYLFRATATHNPSYWQFYLSKPGFNAAQQPLTWADLELIGEADNLSPVTLGGEKYYRLSLTLPAGRSGGAVLYTRWQRDDAAGEGFYNCSDIQILGEDNPVTWTDGGYLLAQDPAPGPGDVIWFRLFDHDGAELVFEKLAITQANQALASWTAELAQRLNGGFGQWLKLGVKEGEDIRFDSAQPLANKVWLSDGAFSHALDLKKAPASVTLSGLASQYQQGDNLALTLASSNGWQGQLLLSRDGSILAQWPLSLTAGASLDQAYLLAETGQYQLSLQGEGGDSQQWTFIVQASGDYDYVYPQGLGSYQAGTLVLGSDNKRYQCKPFPFSGWCNLAPDYYGPPDGSAWQDAWTPLE
ncbi:lytic polysaccharide monooxygenase [Gallaecimonas xiamenensis]|uniref:Chitinase B n=1 Tax=Gallaecimonas xiamenensis 3-C-1 TaxID=745411 RepID=K2KKD5_9GAMM|nr:lytic polysaccharide monooxygenase [Gallaecimonas xiamenensis]EKE77855.1 chitinase B [Gallaecimonas xiamenensis 3-C-1]